MYYTNIICIIQTLIKERRNALLVSEKVDITAKKITKDRDTI